MSSSTKQRQPPHKVTGWSTNMQSLVVQALAMRQLGRLNPRHLLAAGYGLRQAEWCPRTIHTRQLWGCSAFPALGCHSRPALRGRDAVRGWSVNPLRFKSNKKKSEAKTVKEDEEEEDEEEDKKDPEDSDYEEEVEENLPKDYKDIEKHVQSFRYDVIMKAGLDMARNKIEVSFYDNKLRLNGQKLIKKSKTVKVGDTLDLVLSENGETNTVTLMRVCLRRVLEEMSHTEKYKVAIRRWKCLELPKEEAFKP
ncbi:mitochondrial transcription rescue factor 1 isoform X1 [Gymnodraco acuticeps]|uniref:Mitochondrial transcription rescue factor 1 isoform X1 n=3 Tax=Gymnodraco acuticeps TaxID=8218 RepID=A0A6P8TDC9_GYMAC|nr:mitochondrial transcription rescue factor 1 isoform X1 [Gymnodraco acuticeps]XP_034061894.1 mitochondrial transcription rescue factor 1 isoform X1 [Gymnodraco acuticeps]